MHTSLLQSVFRTRFNISCNPIQIQARRNYCFSLNAKSILTQPRTSLPYGPLAHIPIGLHSTTTTLRGTNMKAIFSPSPLQRWISTSPRACFRDHPRRRPRESHQFLGFLNKIPHNTIFYGIIGLNSVVFVMWFMANQQWKQERDPSGIFWMRKNFTNSWNNIISGRIWTPLTACFSHEDVSHILLNGFTFFFMAPSVLEILGSRQFILLYLGGGMFASFTSSIYSKINGQGDYASHGASGAIFSIVTFLACVAPTMKFALYGIIPVPAWLAVSGLFAYDMYSTISHTSGTTDTVGHVGGVLGGILYFVGKRFRMF